MYHLSIDLPTTLILGGSFLLGVFHAGYRLARIETRLMSIEKWIEERD